MLVSTTSWRLGCTTMIQLILHGLTLLIRSTRAVWRGWRAEEGRGGLLRAGEGRGGLLGARLAIVSLLCRCYMYVRNRARVALYRTATHN
eukprot:SAG31_NODE_3153_length_4614_cov_6.385604_4_plen_90_part_00